MSKVASSESPRNCSYMSDEKCVFTIKLEHHFQGWAVFSQDGAIFCKSRLWVSIGACEHLGSHLGMTSTMILDLSLDNHRLIGERLVNF